MFKDPVREKNMSIEHLRFFMYLSVTSKKLYMLNHYIHADEINYSQSLTSALSSEYWKLSRMRPSRFIVCGATTSKYSDTEMSSVI